MISPKHQALSIVRQCDLLSINRSGYYYNPLALSTYDIHIIELIEHYFSRDNSMGVRRMTATLRRDLIISEKKVRRLMRLMCFLPVYQQPRTTLANKQHKKYPYLLKDIDITKPNQVWCADITYLRVDSGFFYLVGIMDWYSKKILSWRLSNEMTTDFCIDALKEAIDIYGVPEIFNTDQGSQFTDSRFIETLTDSKIKISMDGKGRWVDNRMIERFWRTVKYEMFYKENPKDGHEALRIIRSYIAYYNDERVHSNHRVFTPSEAYLGQSCRLSPIAVAKTIQSLSLLPIGQRDANKILSMSRSANLMQGNNPSLSQTA